VLDAVDVPVVAAGGIGGRRAVTAVLAAGADGVRVGTRFVAARESAAHPDYVAALISATSADTVLTEAFSYDWPDAPHRVLRSAVSALEAHDADVVGTRDDGSPLHRGSADPPTRGMAGVVAATALYAGQSVDSVTRIQPAAEIVRELMGSS
jgi:nitronate monooxygenase